MAADTICIRGLKGIPEILPGMNLGEKILSALEQAGIKIAGSAGSAGPADAIVVVVAQKVVSKSEGCLIRLDEVVPSVQARAWARAHHKDPRVVEVVLQQARRVVRMDRGVLIAETHHGFVCANAGVDTSNAPEGTVVLLPPDPDKSAKDLRQVLEAGCRRQVGVIISDTFGRPWRLGLTNVAIGVSGLSAFIDYRGQVDSFGRSLQATTMATADELAGAAELVMGKTAGVPAALIEGFHDGCTAGSGREMIRPAEDDLFR